MDRLGTGAGLGYKASACFQTLNRTFQMPSTQQEQGQPADWYQLIKGTQERRVLEKPRARQPPVHMGTGWRQSAAATAGDVPGGPPFDRRLQVVQAGPPCTGLRGPG